MSDTKLKLVQFGCGSCCPDEWENYDVSPALTVGRWPVLGPMIFRNGSFPANARYGDIVKGLPVTENSVDVIYSSHVLEHLYKDDCETAVHNVLAHLKPGGVFRFVVPDLRRMARAYLDYDVNDGGLRFFGGMHVSPAEKPRGLIKKIRFLYGHSAHRWMWDYRGLADLLQRSGFSQIREANMGDSDIAEFASVEMADRYELAVCVEAIK